MSEEQSFEEMLDQSFKTIRNGEVVEATVIDVKPDEAYMNIGYKADGILTKEEYSNDNKAIIKILQQSSHPAISLRSKFSRQTTVTDRSFSHTRDLLPRRATRDWKRLSITVKFSLL